MIGFFIYAVRFIHSVRFIHAVFYAHKKIYFRKVYKKDIYLSSKNSTAVYAEKNIAN